MVHADVAPAGVKAFFDLIRPNGFEVVAQEVSQADFLVLGEVGGAFEKASLGSDAVFQSSAFLIFFEIFWVEGLLAF
jgi:hypothetical protein